MMFKDESLVSVIVPAFNAERYIGDFMDGIIDQGYVKWELIIVDDGSSDSTIEIIKRYKKLDDRIKLIRRNRDPKGSVTCRNIGQVAAKGKYIIHFDADDLVEKFCLEQRVRFMDSNPDVDYATFRGESVTIGDDGEATKTGHSWGEDPGTDMLSCFLEVKYPFSVWNNIYRASKFKNVLWDERVLIYTDFSYIVPTILDGYRHAFDKDSSPDYLYRVGQTTNAMTSNFISDGKYSSTKYLFDKTMDRLKKTNRFGYYKKKFKNYFILQYERLLVNGTPDQIEDYCAFYEKHYGSDVRIRLVYSALKKRISDGRRGNFRRRVRLYIYAMYHPQNILKWIIHRAV